MANRDEGLWEVCLLSFLLVSSYLPVSLEFGFANLTPRDLVVVIIGLVLVWRFFFGGGEISGYEFLRVPALWSVLGLTIYGAFQIPFAESKVRVLIEILQLSEVLLLGLLLWGKWGKEITERDISIVLNIFFWFSLLGALNSAIYATMTGNQFVGSASVWFAFGSISYGFFYSLYRALLTEKRWYFVPLGIFFWAIIISEHRGLWMTLILASLVMFFTYSILRKRLIIFGVVILSFLLIVGYFGIIPNSVTNHFDSIISGRVFQDVRFYRWASYGLMFIDNPFGVGLGNARYNIRNFAVFEPSKIGVPASKLNSSGPPGGSIIGAHSDWFALLGETGVVGVILYGIFWGVILKEIVFASKNCSIQFLTVGSFLLVIFGSSFVALKLLVGQGVTMVMMYYFLTKLRELEG